MSNIAQILGMNLAELQELKKTLDAYRAMINSIILHLLPEHCGKFLIFNDETGEFKIVASGMQILENLDGYGPAKSVYLIQKTSC